MNETISEIMSAVEQPGWDEWVALNLARGCPADGLLRGNWSFEGGVNYRLTIGNNRRSGMIEPLSRAR